MLATRTSLHPAAKLPRREPGALRCRVGAHVLDPLPLRSADGGFPRDGEATQQGCGVSSARERLDTGVMLLSVR